MKKELKIGKWYRKKETYTDEYSLDRLDNVDEQGFHMFSESGFEYIVTDFEGYEEADLFFEMLMMFKRMEEKIETLSDNNEKMKEELKEELETIKNHIPEIE